MSYKNYVTYFQNYVNFSNSVVLTLLKNYTLMKFKLLIPALILVALSCKKEHIDEIPPNISIVKTVENVADTLLVAFPEGSNILLKNPELMSDTVEKNIILTKESNVYVTFIDEGADYKNTLCWYSYNQSNPPLKATDIKGTVLFPNISKKGEGGQLEAGYTLQLGTVKFPAGTVIGFYLIINGWNNGTIDYNKPFYYTNYNFNKSGKQQSILFKNKYSGYLIEGFEDMDLTNTLDPSDKDYNDILFAVTDNLDGYEATSFDLSKVVKK